MKFSNLIISSFILLLILSLSLFLTPINAEIYNHEETNIEKWEENIKEFFGNLEEEGYEEKLENLTEEDILIGIASLAITPIIIAIILEMTIIFLMMIPPYIYFSLTIMIIAKKLNVSNYWLAWIPILQFIIFFKCAKLSPWFTVLLFIPIINIFFGIIFLIYGWMRIAENRGFEPWYGVLIIVPGGGIIIPGYLAWAEPKSKTE